MKKLTLVVLIAGMLSSGNIFGQIWPTGDESGDDDTSGIKYGAIIGAVTVDGKNYQQFGLRTDIPIGKLGFGMDIQLLLDEKGSIYKGDWDEWTDYLDKIYYIRWGRKGDPFYIKAGGLNFTTLGYGNILDSYTNMIEYPSVKRYGLDMSLKTRFVDAELIINNFKELMMEDPSMLVGTRIALKPLKKLAFGVSVASDFNEYNGLKDVDEDGYPDKLDAFPTDAALVTEYDLAFNNWVAKNPSYTAADLTQFNNNVKFAEEYYGANPTRKENLFNKNNNRSQLYIYSFDAGYPIIEGSKFSLDIFSHWTQISGYGWGMTMPGVRMKVGNFLTFTAEYRRQSSQFLYGYFNVNYELERAVFVQDPTTNSLVIKTKQRTLLEVDQTLDGYFAGLNINLFKLAYINFSYADMIGDELNRRSLIGELGLKKGLIPKISTIKGYYRQDNVENFLEWRTPATIMGGLVELEMGGVNIAFDYRWNFTDLNGDGLIRDKDENIKNIAVRTSVKF